MANDYVDVLPDEKVTSAIRAIDSLPKIRSAIADDAEKTKIAVQIANKAVNMGIPPNLALAIAYHESGFDPSRIGTSKEVGVMQVLPSTAESMGFSPKEMKSDVNQQIDAGLRVLKTHLDEFTHPELAVIAYNAGPGVASFKKEIPESTNRYLDSITQLGGFGSIGAPIGQMPKDVAGEEKPVKEETTDAEGTTWVKPPETPMESTPEQAEDERVRAQLAGGMAGAPISAKRIVSGALHGAGRTIEEGKLAARARAMADAEEAAKRSAIREAAAARPGGVMPTEDQATRILQGTTGEAGTTGRARMGFNEITSQRAAAAAEQERILREMHLRGLLPESPESLRARIPIVGATPSGVIVPPEITPPPARPSGGLERVTQMFRDMMSRTEPVTRALKPVARPLLGAARAVGPIGAGVELGGSAYDIAHGERDPMKLGRAGLGTAAAIMSLIPGPDVVALPILGGLMYDAYRRGRAPTTEDIKYGIPGTSSTR